MTVRDKRTFMEDYVLTVLRSGNPRNVQSSDLAWLAEKTWNEIEKRAPYER